jgi:aryl-alcohol dehydrogenase-like predicted oxidoreductase
MSDTTTGTAAAAGPLRLGDLEVNRLGYGAMRITGPGVWGEPADSDAARAVLRRAVELEVTLIDTADAYGPEVSERLIAETLHPYAAGLVIATKGGLVRSGPNRWRPDCSPAHLREACEGSLRRLRLECIDLYQLHTVDPKVPYEESVGALAELQREGRIRHVGVCNVTAVQLEQARALVEVVSVQNRYNLTDRSSEAVLEVCTAEGLGFLPWYPLAVGSLANPGTPLADLARARGATAGQLALAWLLHRSPVMLPIPGTGSVRHLEENVAAAAVRLDDAEFQRIAALHS